MINKKNIVTIAILSIAISGTVLPALKYPTVGHAMTALKTASLAAFDASTAANKTIVFNEKSNWFVEKPNFVAWTNITAGLSEFVTENSKLKVIGTKDAVIGAALTNIITADNDFINTMKVLWNTCFNKPQASPAELKKAGKEYEHFGIIIRNIDAAIINNTKLTALQPSKKDAITILKEWAYRLQNIIVKAMRDLKNVTT